MARRGHRRSGSRGGFGMSKLLKIGAFAIGAAILLPKVVPIDSKLAGAAGGFIAGGPIGAVAGYIAGPYGAGMLGGGLSGSSSGQQVYG